MAGLVAALAPAPAAPRGLGSRPSCSGRLRVAPARGAARLAPAVAARARPDRGRRHDRRAAQLLDDHRPRRRHRPARADVGAEAPGDAQRPRPHGADLHRLVPVPRLVPVCAGHRDGSVGAADRLAAGGGAAHGFAPWPWRPRRCDPSARPARCWRRQCRLRSSCSSSSRGSAAASGAHPRQSAR